MAWRSIALSPVKRRIHCQLLDLRVTTQRRRQARPECPDTNWVHPFRIDHSGNFDSCRAGQIGDQTIIDHVDDEPVPPVVNYRFHYLGNNDAVVLGAMRKIGESVAATITPPRRGDLLPRADTRDLRFHVVDMSAISHRQTLRTPEVGLLEPLQLREELNPVRPAVWHHAEGVDRPPHNLVTGALTHKRNGVAAITQPERHDARAVVDTADCNRQDQLLLGDTDELGKPWSLIGPR